MIPKKIHYCWLSGDKFPALIERCLSTWKKNLPDYEFILWDQNRFNIDAVPWVKEAFISKKYAFAADYIRLYALYHEGGIYLDADVEVLKSFDDFLDLESFIGFEASGDLEPAIIGAVPGCDWLKKSLSYYSDRYFIRENGSIDTLPLPSILGSILNIKKVLSDNGTVVNPICVDDLVFYPAEFFSPKVPYTGTVHITPRTYAIHHFDGHWVEDSLINKIKIFVHRLLYLVFGRATHEKIVKFIRITFRRIQGRSATRFRDS